MKRGFLIIYILYLCSHCNMILAQSSWVNTSVSGRIDAISISPKGILFAFKCVAALGTTDSIFYSIDSGYTWSKINTTLPANILSVCFNSKGYIFAGSSSGGILRSTNNGISWTSINPSGIQWVNILALAVDNKDQIIAGYYPGYIYKSTDDGNSWTCLKNFYTTNQSGSMPVEFMTLAIDSIGTIFVGYNYYVGPGDYCSFYRHNNNGETWDEIMSSLENVSYPLLAINKKGDVFVGTYSNGIYHYTPNDTILISVNNGLTNTKVTALVADGSNLFAGTDDGVFISRNNGANWTDCLINKRILSLASSGTNVFVGTYGGLWLHSISDIVSSVNNQLKDPLIHFNLEQNFPNPFNPSTTISFNLPATSMVTLKVYDLLGREVATLVDGELSAGNHSRQWNAAQIPSGVYFYQLRSGSFVETKKLALLR